MPDHNRENDRHRKLSVQEIIARERIEAEAAYRFTNLENRLEALGIDKGELEEWIIAKLRP